MYLEINSILLSSATERAGWKGGGAVKDAKTYLEAFEVNNKWPQKDQRHDQQGNAEVERLKAENEEMKRKNEDLTMQLNKVQEELEELKNLLKGKRLAESDSESDVSSESSTPERTVGQKSKASLADTPTKQSTRKGAKTPDKSKPKTKKKKG